MARPRYGSGNGKASGNNDGFLCNSTVSGTGRPTCDLLRRALATIVASETFARSERLRSFLSYIVENEISGKATQLKGYCIGIDVFGRSHGFDAGADPLVRVQAGKLRKLLEQYYEKEGASDIVRIRVPLGSYVPEYSLVSKEPETEKDVVADKPANAPSPVRQARSARRSWLPAPASSPLALFSLLPLIFLAPSIYPEPTNAAIEKAQRVLSVQTSFTSQAQILPQLRIEQCWPAGGDCNALARAISNATGYHRTVRLVETPASGPLSYVIRIENRVVGDGIYARLIHEQSGRTVFTRHFTREQLHGEAGIAYEAVVFAARAFSASGALYRHAIRANAASAFMHCLAQVEQQSARGIAHQQPLASCSKETPDTLADAAAPVRRSTPLVH